MCNMCMSRTLVLPPHCVAQQSWSTEERPSKTRISVSEVYKFALVLRGQRCGAGKLRIFVLDHCLKHVDPTCWCAVAKGINGTCVSDLLGHLHGNLSQCNL